LLLRVAFYTLLERKLIGYTQYRKGPNKVSVIGVLQPIVDAIKLLMKETIKLSYWKLIYYLIAPVVLLGVIIIRGAWIESFYFCVDESKVVGILVVIRLGIYGILFIGWGSNSNYPLLGVHRVLVLMLSYEVCIILILLIFFYLVLDIINFYLVWKIQENLWFVRFSVNFFFVWVLVIARELRRTPFDLAEGESEIVSGVNTEFIGGLFSFLFIAEYGMIILIRFFTVFLFLGAASLILVKRLFICRLLVWMRCSLPRIRYDTYIIRCWKLFLPLLLIFLLIIICL